MNWAVIWFACTAIWGFSDGISVFRWAITTRWSTLTIVRGIAQVLCYVILVALLLQIGFLAYESLSSSPVRFSDSWPAPYFLGIPAQFYMGC